MHFHEFYANHMAILPFQLFINKAVVFETFSLPRLHFCRTIFICDIFIICSCSNLLKIQVKFRDYAKSIAETKGTMSSDSSSAFFSLTQAEYAAGNFKQKVAEGSMTARVRVGAGVDNVAGVKLPVFTKYETGAAADNQSLGLVGGGKKIVAVRDKFTHLLESLIK